MNYPISTGIEEKRGKHYYLILTTFIANEILQVKDFCGLCFKTLETDYKA